MREAARLHIARLGNAALPPTIDAAPAAEVPASPYSLHARRPISPARPATSSPPPPPAKD